MKIFSQTPKTKPKVLFVLRQRKEPWGNGDGYSYCGGYSSGLYNSARFVQEMLVKNGIEANLVEVFDDNWIYKEVNKFNPTHVILEAVVVHPNKLNELTKLYPKIKWIIRSHSEIPFGSMEGNWIDWMLKYVEYPNVSVSNNSKNIQSDFEKLVKYENTWWTPEKVREKVVYLPNYYYPGDNIKYLKNSGDIINIGCFGAIRPLKSHLIQAIAAIEFAEQHHKKLNFHINATRIEGRGDAILKNLQLLFSHFPKHCLVQYGWQTHEEFLKLVKTMDIGMQVSFSETFNITSANFCDEGIPILVSPEISWASRLSQVGTTNTEKIVEALDFVYQNKWLVLWNKYLLRKNARQSEKIWLDYLLK